MNENKITCKDVMHHICDSLGEEIDSPKYIAIKEHLGKCENCQNYFSSVESTIKFYKDYDVNLPAEMHNRLMKKLGLE